MSPNSVAVLGAGLTGLSSAYHLSRRFPNSKITLLEKQLRLGGWVQTERKEIKKLGASILLEGGPRTLRLNSKSVLELIHLLRLEDSVITVPKTAPPAKARYLYIPKSYGTEPSGMQRIPSSIMSLLFSPLLRVMLPPILLEPFKKANRNSENRDESVDSFLTRRFGATFARTFGSALAHGVYSADSRKLSVRAAFPAILDAEERGMGSLVRGMLVPSKKKAVEPYELGEVEEMMQGVSVYSFRDGMETLTRALETALRAAPNVNILPGTHISSLGLSKNPGIEISHSHGMLHATHVVSTLPLPTLHNLIPDDGLSFPMIPHLTENPMSTVQVVNFVFPCPPKDVHPEGFGYLIPRPPTGYPTKSASQGILGTVFDSCSLHAQDLPVRNDYYNQATHTKLTMMTGGPYPLHPLPAVLSSSSCDDTLPPFISGLLRELETHLNKTLPKPVYWRIWNNENCIPTLLPGHLERMEEMRASVERTSATWQGRLAVIGAGVGGVSVGDCVEAGRRVGRAWAQ